MRIAIIGAGNVGSALGRGWPRAGEDAVFGVPNPADPKYNPLPRERLLTPQVAARNTQTVVLATPWQATETAVKGLGDLSGKIVIDCTNPLEPTSGCAMEMTHRRALIVCNHPDMSGWQTTPSREWTRRPRRGKFDHGLAFGK